MSELSLTVGHPTGVGELVGGAENSVSILELVLKHHRTPLRKEKKLREEVAVSDPCDSQAGSSMLLFRGLG